MPKSVIVVTEIVASFDIAIDAPELVMQPQPATTMTMTTTATATSSGIATAVAALRRSSRTGNAAAYSYFSAAQRPLRAADRHGQAVMATNLSDTR